MKTAQNKGMIVQSVFRRSRLSSSGEIAKSSNTFLGFSSTSTCSTEVIDRFSSSRVIVGITSVGNSQISPLSVYIRSQQQMGALGESRDPRGVLLQAVGSQRGNHILGRVRGQDAKMWQPPLMFRRIYSKSVS